MAFSMTPLKIEGGRERERGREREMIDLKEVGGRKIHLLEDLKNIRRYWKPKTKS